MPVDSTRPTTALFKKKKSLKKIRQTETEYPRRYHRKTIHRRSHKTPWNNISLAMNPLFIYRSNLFPFIYPLSIPKNGENFLPLPTLDRTLCVSNLFLRASRFPEVSLLLLPPLPSPAIVPTFLLSSILIIALDSISPYLRLDKTKKFNRVI